MMVALTAGDSVGAQMPGTARTTVKNTKLKNLALAAEVTSTDGSATGLEAIHDDNDNTGYLSGDDPTLPHVLTFTWSEPQTFSNVALTSWYCKDQAPTNWDIEVSTDGTSGWTVVASSGDESWLTPMAGGAQAIQHKILTFDAGEPRRGLRLRVNRANLTWRHFAILDVRVFADLEPATLAVDATASATGGTGVDKLNDIQSRTSYVSAEEPTFPQHLTLTFPATRTFDAVTLKSQTCQSRAPTRWAVQVSADGTGAWQDVATTEIVKWQHDDATVEGHTLTFSPVSAKAVRVQIDAANLVDRRFEVSDLEVSLTPVSYIDTAGPKVRFMVGGRPFFYNGIQSSPHRLMDNDHWTWDDMEQTFRATAADGFTVMGIPLRWKRLEPERDVFDFTETENAIRLSAKYGLKLEILWFGSNVCGGPYDSPEWVLAEFQRVQPRRYHDPLDFADAALLARERVAVARLMEHVKTYQDDNGLGNVTVGIQLLNEPNGYGRSTSPAGTDLWKAGGYTHDIIYNIDVMLRYVGGLAEEVKKSRYPVWTRVNLVFFTADTYGDGVVYRNEYDRATSGTDIDIMGADAYSESFTDIRNNLANPAYMWSYGKNLPMISESGGHFTTGAQMLFNTLSVDGVYKIWEINDSIYSGQASRWGLYYTDPAAKTIKEKGHTASVRDMNNVVKKIGFDLASQSAQGANVKFINRDFAATVDTTVTVGGNKIRYRNGGQSGAAIVVARSATEYAFVGTADGGDLAVPAGLTIKSLQAGAFDADNQWVREAEVRYTTEGAEKRFPLGRGCVRLVYE